jgi:AcrR family transcriptional regulator
MTKKRLRPDDRKQQILTAAIKVAGRPGGWAKLTRDAVAREAECADALVSKYFGTMLTFRRTIMRAAIVRADLSVIAQGLAAGDKCAQKADPELKARALNTLAG